MSTETASRNPFHGMRRYPERGVIAGVCEGLAVHFDWNVRLVRVLAVLLLVFTGFWPSVVAYCLAWYVVEPVGAEPAPSAAVPPTGPAPSPAAGGAPTVPMPELKARFGRLEDRLRAVEACVVSDELNLRRELRKLEG